ncbi:MAG TPA: patatin-like phospholipase family protein [Roseiflexaceae bacterium]|jgi:NTE family protein|nr:patatin-like phospholipase family protein [Roseiflexaceae bacterium]
MAASKKALVLSGGGGRGAYHIGVIEALVEQGWMEDGKGPDIIAGTSIGAINAAALASGMTVAQLRQCWLSMHTEDVHRLSSDIPPVSRPLLRFLLRSILTSEAHDNPSADLPNDEKSMSAQGLITRLRDVFRVKPFRSLLDTTPWRSTLSHWMNFARINSEHAPALLLAATNLQSGGLEVFCNRDRPGHPRDTITLNHLMASSSIPIVYPWTELDGAKYWDGAVLANTPLGPVIDLAGDEDVDIVVVMMTPWHEDSAMQAQLEDVPQDLVQALSLTLDWALLASYRAALKSLRSYNRLAEAAEKLERAAEQSGDWTLRMQGPVPRRISEPTVVAPEDLISLEWIVDYEERNHHALFAQGKADAMRALRERGV